MARESLGTPALNNCCRTPRIWELQLRRKRAQYKQH